MSACEKCWRDAHSSDDVAARYSELIEERKANPCTPEEQAGPDGRWCAGCKGWTRHQYTGECMSPNCTAESENDGL